MTDSFDPNLALRYADDLARRAKEMEEEAKAIEIDATSRDRSVTVTVSLAGKILDLRMTQDAMEGRTHTELSAAILDVLKSAQQMSEQAAKSVTEKHLPDASQFTKTLRAATEQRWNAS